MLTPPMLLVLLAGLVLAGCSPGERAADFRVSLYDGKTFQLSEQTREGVVVVNFWYPSCPPCREEMPHFEEAWQQLRGQDVRFLGLFVPQGFDSEENARDFIRELSLSFDFATDIQAQVARTYEVSYFPTTYFIDRDGRVFSVKISNLDTAAIVGTVRDMIGSPSPVAAPPGRSPQDG